MKGQEGDCWLGVPGWGLGGDSACSLCAPVCVQRIAAESKPPVARVHAALHGNFVQHFAANCRRACLQQPLLRPCLKVRCCACFVCRPCCPASW